VGGQTWTSRDHPDRHVAVPVASARGELVTVEDGSEATYGAVEVVMDAGLVSNQWTLLGSSNLPVRTADASARGFAAHDHVRLFAQYGLIAKVRHWQLNNLAELPQRERVYWYKFAMQLLHRGPGNDSDLGTPW
jgi:hypothetical protein